MRRVGRNLGKGRDMHAAGKVTSSDGTSIAFERTGAGPALVAVDAAGSYSGFRPLPPPVELLAAHFTVYVYDRRGRGASGDTLPYAVQREVDDLAALIAEAGGSAFVYAFSSGGLLALHAAASGLAIPKLALLEPPIEPRQTATGEPAFTAELAELVAAGRRRDAVEFFNRGIGVPDEIMEQTTPPVWAALEAIAHTFVYDCMISDATSFELVRSVTAPTLVLNSQGSSDDLTGMGAAVAEALPNGTHRSLAGEWHGVPDDILAPVLTEFLRGSRSPFDRCG
jgi:pimeloyl-ACP methyl ester carboxylesterase